ncbi:YdcF family protein [Paenibacillus sp. SAFN-117]|uniref:YdcF family protein n=1 Tax=Paenibacillus sp. SAFN-117 TaxID=3436860 RepID=UPI003F7FAC18
MKRRKAKALFWLKTAGILAGLLVLWVGYVQWKIYSVQHSQNSEPADVAIVLGAALWNGVPSPGLRERLEGAVDLYEQGIVDKFILSGGLGTHGSTVTEAEGMKRYLLERGIPESDLFKEDEARNTLQNLSFSQNIMKANQWTTAIIVTHHYHGARALDMARFLHFENPRVYTVDSEVMNITWHKTRETLAYGKWTLDKWMMWLGLSSAP